MFRTNRYLGQQCFSTTRAHCPSASGATAHRRFTVIKRIYPKSVADQRVTWPDIATPMGQEPTTQKGVSWLPTSWEPAKKAARLQAATASGKPIVLRVDYEAGHGFGSTKTQIEDELADEWSFLLWQFQVAGFQPSR